MTLDNTNIILIGPGGSGKSTTGQLLAEKLNRPWIELDNLRWTYHDEIGYDKEKAAQLRREKGFVAVVAYWEKFTVYALERVLQDYPAGHIISTGAGNVVFNNADYTQRAKQALKPYPYVVLVQPSVDIEESIRICTQRIIEQSPVWKIDPVVLST